MHAAATVPARAGIGLRAEHYRDLLAARPEVGWLEVHSENYFGIGDAQGGASAAGDTTAWMQEVEQRTEQLPRTSIAAGAPLYYLEQARARYPVSLHGVGLSLGSTDPLNRTHLAKLKRLIERFEPGLVSDHLCWCSVGGTYLNDLLPLPYTEEALEHFCARVSAAQDFLGRQLLIENPSSYLAFAESRIPEQEFLTEIARRSGCALLLDVNNVYVSACNHGFDARAYLDAIPSALVGEIHLAGFSVNHYPEGNVLIDTHSAPVWEPVWELYRHTLARLGPKPTLIEWDTDLPPLTTLVAEAQRAQKILNESCANAA